MYLSYFKTYNLTPPTLPLNNFPTTLTTIYTPMISTPTPGPAYFKLLHNIYFFTYKTNPSPLLLLQLLYIAPTILRARRCVKKAGKMTRKFQAMLSTPQLGSQRPCFYFIPRLLHRVNQPTLQTRLLLLLLILHLAPQLALSVFKSYLRPATTLRLLRRGYLGKRSTHVI